MRVLLVTDTSGHMRGGVPAETRRLINGLIARGHSVALCGDVPVPGSEGATHFPIRIPVDAGMAAQVGNALGAFKPDVVHVVSMSSRGILLLRKALARVPWIMTCHSIPPHERKLAGLHASEAAHYGARAIRFLPNAAAWWWLLHRGVVPRVIVHCEWMRSLLASYGQPASSTSLILLGCDIKDAVPATVEPSPRAVGPRVVTIAGLAHTKGYHDALRAVAMLRERYADITYQIIGEVRDDSYLRYLQSLIAALDLGSCVRLTLNLPDDQKQQALQSADLYLQPSHEEGFCLAFIEAAQCVPRLVGTDTGAIGRISEGDAGARVVPPKDPRAMAAAMAALLQESLQSGLMQERAERLEARFGWRHHLDAHVATYQSMLAAA